METGWSSVQCMYVETSLDQQTIGVVACPSPIDRTCSIICSATVCHILAYAFVVARLRLTSASCSATYIRDNGFHPSTSFLRHTIQSRNSYLGFRLCFLLVDHCVPPCHLFITLFQLLCLLPFFAFQELNVTMTGRLQAAQFFF